MLMLRNYRLYTFNVVLQVEIRIPTAHDSSEPTGRYEKQDKILNVVAPSREQAALWIRERYKNVQITDDSETPIDAIVLNLTH
jgi:hypothetical protein